MDLHVHLNDVRAAVPLFTRDLSYVNNALIRPIVAYINSKKAFIPINCRVVKRASEFDGSWTIFDSGLMDDLSRETYEAFARDIVDYDARTRRLKKVGLWTIQLAAQALFIGLAGQLA
ncbi:Mitochondrial distribution and morphology protein 31, mitochondrial precursor [Cryomyces antarcticus]|nr:Mitochondrial distribution and morphology protein 31, mitochondrial precursor [Cryomyces antarcticus]